MLEGKGGCFPAHKEMAESTAHQLACLLYCCVMDIQVLIVTKDFCTSCLLVVTV